MAQTQQVEVVIVRADNPARQSASPNPSPKPEPDPDEERRREEEAGRALRTLQEEFSEFCAKSNYNPPAVPMSALNRLAVGFKKVSAIRPVTSVSSRAWDMFLGDISQRTKALKKFKVKVSSFLSHVPLLKRVFGYSSAAPNTEVVSDTELDDLFDPNLSSNQIMAYRRHEHMVSDLSEKPGLSDIVSMSVFRNQFNGLSVIQLCFPRFGSVLVRIDSPLDPVQAAREHLFRLRYAFAKILGKSTPISILNGDLRDLNFKDVLPGKPLVRAARTEDQALVKSRIQRATTRSPIRPETSAVISGLPQTPEELRNLFPRDEGTSLDTGGPSWAVWRNQFTDWRGSISAAGFELGDEALSSEGMLKALSERQDVIVLIAHAASDKLYFPDGTQVTPEDILSRKEEISKNAPSVYLFCCEAAKFEQGARNVVEALLDAGASSVTAPQIRINAHSSRMLCAAFLLRAKSSVPIEALAAAEAETNNTDLETWVG
jgi:hypothetical protein